MAKIPDLDKVIENGEEIEVRIGGEVARGAVLSVEVDAMPYGVHELITIKMLRAKWHDDN